MEPLNYAYCSQNAFRRTPFDFAMLELEARIRQAVWDSGGGRLWGEMATTATRTGCTSNARLILTHWYRLYHHDDALKGGGSKIVERRPNTFRCMLTSYFCYGFAKSTCSVACIYELRRSYPFALALAAKYPPAVHME